MNNSGLGGQLVEGLYLVDDDCFRADQAYPYCRDDEPVLEPAACQGQGMSQRSQVLSPAPPRTNRGVVPLICQTGNDYVSASFRKEGPTGKALLAELTKNRLDVKCWDLVEGATRIGGWKQVWKGPAGIELWTSNARLGDHIVIKGQGCSFLGQDTFMAILGTVKVASRLDVRLDDYRRVQTPLQVWELLHGTRDPGVVCKATVGKWWEDQNGAGTCYWGSRSSERMLRVYDKGAESDGKIDAFRWELEHHDKAAEGLRRTLVEAYKQEGLAGVDFAIRGALRGFIDFRVCRGARDNTERWDRTAWWEELTGEASVLRPGVDDQRSGKERRAGYLKWASCQLPAVLAAFEGSGVDIRHVMGFARRRFTARQKRIAAGQVA